jgi:AcrR family transcriptional regulator
LEASVIDRPDRAPGHTDGAPHPTCERLLDVAEQLFAEHGFDATSVRDLTTTAGCNIAAVNYHFGGKHNLYVATFRRLLADVRERREKQVNAALDSAGENASLETFLYAFTMTFADPLGERERSHRLMAFMDQEMRSPQLPAEVFLEELLLPTFQLTQAALTRVGLTMSDTTLAMCMTSLVGQIIHALKAYHMMHCTPLQRALLPTDLTTHLEHIVRFSAAGFRTCAVSAEEDR